MDLFFKDIFEYNHHFNQKIANQLIENEPKVSARVISLFSHVINAQQIWNVRITENKNTLAVNQIHSFEDCKKIDIENYQQTIQILETYELDKTIQYANSKGDKFENTVRQILFHVSNHSSHHRGQIIADLKQNGIEPMITDYIFYKR